GMAIASPRQGRRPGPSPRISREHIVRAVRAKPVADLSMRSIAQMVGVTPAALYRYFPDRNSVLVAVADDVASSMLLPEPSPDWRSWLQDFGDVLYRMLIDY